MFQDNAPAEEEEDEEYEEEPGVQVPAAGSVLEANPAVEAPINPSVTAVPAPVAQKRSIDEVNGGEETEGVQADDEGANKKAKV